MVVVSPAAANGKREGPMSGEESAGEMNHNNNIYTQQDMACYLCICQNILIFLFLLFCYRCLLSEERPF